MSETSHAANGTAKNSARAMPTVKHLIFAFIAGFFAVLVFQQGLRAALVAGGAGTATPYSLAPTAVGGVPQVLDRAFWGGVWGILLVMVESRVPRRPAYAYWIVALAFGALLPSLFAWFVVAPIKGKALAAGGDPVRLAVTLATNGAWGVGTAALYRFVLPYIRGRGTSANGTQEAQA